MYQAARIRSPDFSLLNSALGPSRIHLSKSLLPSYLQRMRFSCKTRSISVGCCGTIIATQREYVPRTTTRKNPCSRRKCGLAFAARLQ